MNSNVLQTPIEYLKGVGPSRAELLRKEMGIATFQDLVNFFPNRYIDRTGFFKIKNLVQNSAEVQIIGKVVHLKMVDQKRGKRLVAHFVDETGQMELVWFRGQKWIKDSIKINVPYVIFGKVNWFNGVFSMPHPEMELLEDYKKDLRTAMQPVYPSSEKMSNKGMTNRAVNKLMQQLFIETQGRFLETLSAELLQDLKLIPKADALFNIHFPKSHELLAKAQFRLKFEELFYVQLQLIIKNLIRKQKIKGYTFDQVGELFNEFYSNHLPFDLTDAQKRVIKEIRNDLGSGAQMNRLLQGDVGS
ncbi:MAG TPA: OB-fold nucleic acid binding domain-containing protein, partial [Salinimicrobium sp.]|nr:OB-fold nucleic acid binding domain-containing protein [Salinimicrobium sp.]